MSIHTPFHALSSSITTASTTIGAQEDTLVGEYESEEDVVESPTVMIELPFGGMTEQANFYPNDGRDW